MVNPVCMKSISLLSAVVVVVDVLYVATASVHQMEITNLVKNATLLNAQTAMLDFALPLASDCITPTLIIAVLTWKISRTRMTVFVNLVYG